MTSEEQKFMTRELILSRDGSHTLELPLMGETYHSKHGAVTESLYIYITKGLHTVDQEEVKVFEVGFGTGLNPWLTYFESLETNKKVTLHTIEAYPLNKDEYTYINYANIRPYENGQEVFTQMHDCSWGETHQLSDHFSFTKHLQKLEDFETQETDFDLIYYDAYAPNHQEDMWAVAHFEKMRDLLKTGGKLVTYCSSGVFKRALLEAGLEVSKMEGPPGKREMMVGTKV